MVSQPALLVCGDHQRPGHRIFLVDRRTAARLHARVPESVNGLRARPVRREKIPTATRSLGLQSRAFRVRRDSVAFITGDLSQLYHVHRARSTRLHLDCTAERDSDAAFVLLRSLSQSRSQTIGSVSPLVAVPFAAVKFVCGRRSRPDRFESARREPGDALHASFSTARSENDPDRGRIDPVRFDRRAICERGSRQFAVLLAPDGRSAFDLFLYAAAVTQ